MAHDERGADHRMVVGVDGSRAATAVLGWAVHHAALTGAVVEAVTAAWELSAGKGRPAPPGADDPYAAARLLADAIAEVEELALVLPQVLKGHPAQVLIDASATAELLVVGDRKRSGGFVGAPLGAVSQRCVQHALCPVMVIRGTWPYPAAATAALLPVRGAPLPATP